MMLRSSRLTSVKYITFSVIPKQIISQNILWLPSRMKPFMNFRIATTKGMFLTCPPLIFAPCIDFRNKNKDVTEPMIPIG
jgi:hypothetical protein